MRRERTTHPNTSHVTAAIVGRGGRVEGRGCPAAVRRAHRHRRRILDMREHGRPDHGSLGGRARGAAGLKDISSGAASNAPVYTGARPRGRGRLAGRPVPRGRPRPPERPRNGGVWAHTYAHTYGVRWCMLIGMRVIVHPHARVHGLSAEQIRQAYETGCNGARIRGRDRGSEPQGGRRSVSTGQAGASSWCSSCSMTGPSSSSTRTS